MSEVRVGQVYRSNDPRYEGHTFRVIGFEGDGEDRQAVVRVLTNRSSLQRDLDDGNLGEGQQWRDRRGRESRISLGRLVVTNRAGYTLLRDEDSGLETIRAEEESRE